MVEQAQTLRDNTRRLIRVFLNAPTARVGEPT
jgi:hypothetical protein